MSTNNAPLPLRVPFDSLTLTAVVTELRALLVGGQIQDIRQPEPDELRLSIRSQGRSFTLLLSADARFARVHLTERRSANAPSPSAFCIALRRHLENGRITAVRQRGFDRIFELVVQNQTEDGTTTVNTLVAELMGKHSNLILVSDSGTVLEAAKRISHRINRFRETLPGKPYLPPPAPTGRHDPLATPQETAVWLTALLRDAPTSEALARTLQANVMGVSPFLAREIAFRTFQSDSPQPFHLVAAWADTVAIVLNGFHQSTLLQAGADQGAYPIPVRHLPVTQNAGVGSLNTLLDAAFRTQVESADRAAASRDLQARIDREISTQKKQIADAERTIQEAKRADDYTQQGELLLAHLWKVEPGTNQTTVQDFYSAEQTERTIVLDPKLNPQENAQAYFRKAQKARAALTQAESQVAKLAARTATFDSVTSEIKRKTADPTCTAEEIRDLQRRLLEDGILREERSTPGAQPSGPDFQGHKIRRYTTPDGYEIYCGETATANDFLTTRVAAPNDLWLHVRASAGSHVVIRTKGEPDKVPQSVLRRAATIAALHSNQKHSGLVPVDYTLKKHVRKPRGAAPGSVEVQREKTLHVAPHEEEDKG
jgi:predicted ribosome quality control (RQC) complex YloA/Tae2 family protein